MAAPLPPTPPSARHPKISTSRNWTSSLTSWMRKVKRPPAQAPPAGTDTRTRSPALPSKHKQCLQPKEALYKCWRPSQRAMTKVIELINLWTPRFHCDVGRPHRCQQAEGLQGPTPVSCGMGWRGQGAFTGQTGARAPTWGNTGVMPQPPQPASKSTQTSSHTADLAPLYPKDPRCCTQKAFKS